MKESSHVRIILKDICIKMRLGIHPWEKKPQRVLVNVELFVKSKAYLKLSEKTPIVDYDPIRDAVNSWPQRKHTLYIETCLRELLKLAFADKRVDACRVSVVKPDIFPEAAAAGVEVYMTRAEYKKVKPPPPP